MAFGMTSMSIQQRERKNAAGKISAPIWLIKDEKHTYESVRKLDEELGAIVDFTLCNKAVTCKVGVRSSHGLPRDLAILCLWHETKKWYDVPLHRDDSKYSDFRCISERYPN